LGNLVALIIGVALQESLEIGIELGLKLLTKLIGKLLNRRRVVDVVLVEGINVISYLNLVIAQHAASRLNLDLPLFSIEVSKKCVGAG
jgi:uncharacterized membrane protein